MVPWWPWVVLFYIGAATPEPLALLAEELGSRMTPRLRLGSVETKLEPKLTIKSTPEQKTNYMIYMSILYNISILSIYVTVI